jgi:type VI secretion system protein ImpK
VPAGNIETAGLGPTAPVADNATAEGRARNRRVEVIVSGEGITPARR